MPRVASALKLAPPPPAAAPVDGNGDLHGTDLPDRVRAVLEQIRPAVQADGGDVELVDIVDGGTARVRFRGACVGCPSSHLTLHMGIERAVRQQVPQIAKVISVQ